MKVLIACDSFKGTFSSAKAGSIIKKGLEKRGIHDVSVCPVSDGGDGFGSVIAHADGARQVSANVKDAFFGETAAEYHFIGEDAYIESARACGLRFGKDVMRATTYGVGQLIYSAAVNGAKRVYLGLGGSGTNDGGCGMACALGVKFCGSQPFIPTGRNLGEIKSYDLSGLYGIVKKTEIIGCIDVDSVFYGENGASLTFSRQKGATPEEAKRLDEGMKKLASLFPFDINSLPGSGAAGGMGGGIAAFLGGKLERGFDVIARLTKIEEKIKAADAVITGEGRTDGQTAHGKLPIRIAELCKKHRKPCYIVSGSVYGDISPLYAEGIADVFTSYDVPPREIDKAEAEARLADASSRAAEQIKAGIYVSSGDI